MKMKLKVLVMGLATCGLAHLAHANDADIDSSNSWVNQFDLHGTVTISNDYRSRGFSKSDQNPSVQGGFILSHQSGAYLMLWGASNNGPNGGHVEADGIVGYTWQINPTSSLDFSYADVNYPGGTGASPDFGEFGIVYKHKDTFVKNDNLSAAIYYSPDYSFSSGNEYYLWGEYSYPLTSKINVFGSGGYTRQDSVVDFQKGTAPDANQKDYFDWKAGFRADIKGVIAELAWVDNNIKSSYSMYDGRVYASLTKNF